MVKGNAFVLPALGQRLRLGAAGFGQWEIGVTLEAFLCVSYGLPVAQEGDEVAWCSGYVQVDFIPSIVLAGRPDGA
jgi:hypothetical protein